MGNTGPSIRRIVGWALWAVFIVFLFAFVVTLVRGDASVNLGAMAVVMALVAAGAEKLTK